VGTGVLFPGVNAARGWRWPLTPSSAEVKNKELYPSPPWNLYVCSRTDLAFPLHVMVALRGEEV
jgi:hypothetical protein